MDNITTNIGIYFSNPANMLEESGWIKVYDEETGNLLETFTKDLSNANIAIFGMPGSGKSVTVKIIVRQKCINQKKVCNT